ncbi:hypothetical protein HPB48_017411 [Haemaphysalis longicornis]|uniref:Uncharacterized protein n=1 Tax=Haemaphysalis longicornis TaxID=44386 RepID=A0A9J6F9F7_HAELO|nr:hypothetical protein HPB48_017411 [Haemaphysalis longicornis]
MIVIRAFPSAWTLLIGPFIAPEVEHWCAKPHWLNDSLTDEQWKERFIPSAVDWIAKEPDFLDKLFLGRQGSWCVFLLTVMFIARNIQRESVPACLDSQFTNLQYLFL